MTRRHVLAVALVVLVAFLVVALAEATIKYPSEYRKPHRPLVGNIIFGNDLPYLDEDNFVSVKEQFVLGEDKDISARAYYPMLLGELRQELQKRAARVLVKPYLKWHMCALDVFKLGDDPEKDEETREKLFTLEYGSRDFTETAEWDQQRVNLLMAEGEEKSDFWCDERDAAWATYPMKYPFPDALIGKPGRYKVRIEFYDVYEGETGEYTASWDKHAEEIDVTPVEGKLNFITARGEFTLIVR